MASPYDGIDESDLLEIKAALLKALKLKVFTSQNVPGLAYGRRMDSLEDVRKELVLVQAALDALDPETKPVNFTYMRAS